MGTVPEVQHRSEITIWVEDKNTFDYYLADESFVNCFTDIQVKYRCVTNDYYGKYNKSENNICLLPINDVDQNLNTILTNLNELCVFSVNNNVPIIFGCGHKSINSLIPSTFPFKILCNDSQLDDNRIISINSYPIKLWNFYGPDYIEHRRFDVLKEPKVLEIVDDREWWDTEEMEKAAITKITNKDHIWKALMIGQPFIFDSETRNDYFKLDELGFKKYPWLSQDVDIDFVRKNSYYINKHNKQNFNKVVKENNNFVYFLSNL